MTRDAQKPRVKICGLTNREDAEMAIVLGADALGFNLYHGSKRFIDLREEAAWIRQLPPFVAKVAIMVSPTVAEAEAVFALPFIDLVQFHGNETSEFLRHFADAGHAFLKAFPLRDAESFESIELGGMRDVLLDAYSPNAFGGTGQPIDLDLAERFAVARTDLRIILSGGLTPENVAEAVKRLRPYGVDVASGVELKGDPRRKDETRMSEFIRAAKA